jgi:hypothetical protein
MTSSDVASISKATLLNLTSNHLSTFEDVLSSILSTDLAQLTYCGGASPTSINGGFGGFCRLVTLADGSWAHVITKAKSIRAGSQRNFVT